MAEPKFGTNFLQLYAIYLLSAAVPGLVIEKLILVCSRAVISMCEQNVGMHVDNRPPSVMYYPDIQ